MKQTLFMIVVTAIGSFGVLVHPFYGVAVYTLFAVLRPQFMWDWALPAGVGWSRYVAIATIIGAVGMLFTVLPLAQEKEEEKHAGLSLPHYLLLAYWLWIVVAYVSAYDRDVADFYFWEYFKIFLMLMVSTIIVRTTSQLWTLYLITTCSLAYIAYEVNIKYLTEGRMDIWLNGYGGVDNNGAGLMLAVGVPLSLFAWQGTTRWWRWAYLACVPPILHAVMMTFSRGAMVSVLAASPLMALRGSRLKQFALAFLVLASLIPSMAGPEIRARFFTVSSYEQDASANSRLNSWRAAIQIANDHPIFGVGLRNSPLFSHQYGADYYGRVIHSQYFQVLADTGYPGLIIYASLLLCTWWCLRRVRRLVRRRPDEESQRVLAMANGLECGMIVFCVAATFLSVELFELPYLLLFFSAQLHAVVTSREAQRVTNDASRQVVVPPRSPAQFAPQPANLRPVRR
jgi:probable O-glycosylation ligase (exosortase A-associated)